MKPFALGYLRSDLAGPSQHWHEIRIRSLAKRYGYDLAKTIVFSDRTKDPIHQLISSVRNARAEAIFTPHVGHLGADIPSDLVSVCDIITVDDESTYARAYFRVPRDSAVLRGPNPILCHPDQAGLVGRS
ncbi:hypothetical protein [Nocardia coubleae]|uniref:Recombinase family protein n=1 Tax=Nocardia coubleae TaxID=356147 RepID=A0A846WED4_9NOCA|nr:hypothetical protein [Nocardia coubleae]NKX90947.1 hypothetical protein [Nocardia coubleae]